MKRDFKGIWIPKHIWENKGLSPTDRCIFSEISSLSHSGDCYASNRYFSEFFGVSIATVSRSIKKLEEMDLVTVEITKNQHGSKRLVRTNQNDETPSSKCVVRTNQNDEYINTVVNNTINNTKEYSEDFLNWWNQYHRDGKRERNKFEAFEEWKRLSMFEREQCAGTVVDYVMSTPNHKYRKSAKNFLKEKMFRENFEAPTHDNEGHEIRTHRDTDYH